jgi:hypothetical protein
MCRGIAELVVGRWGADGLGRGFEVEVGHFATGVDGVAIEGVVERVGGMGAGGRRGRDLSQGLGLGQGVDRGGGGQGYGSLLGATIDQVAGVVVEGLLEGAGENEEEHERANQRPRGGITEADSPEPTTAGQRLGVPLRSLFSQCERGYMGVGAGVKLAPSCEAVMRGRACTRTPLQLASEINWERRV